MDEKERLHDENIKKAAGGGAWNDNRYNAVYGIDESLCIAISARAVPSAGGWSRRKPKKKTKTGYSVA